MKLPFIAILLLSSCTACALALSCEAEFMPIHSIQGTGAESVFTGQSVKVKGIVTGDFRGQDALSGFFIQQKHADDKTETSEGLFIQSNDNKHGLTVGDVVVVDGVVSERFEVTQLESIAGIKVCERGVELPPISLLNLPFDGFDLEQVEGMRVGFKSPVVITDIYQYLRYGELTVSSELLLSPTAKYHPGENVKKHIAYNNDNRLIVDDGSNSRSPYPHPVGSDGTSPIAPQNTLVVGQRLDVVGVIHYAFGKYKLQPTQKLQFSPFDIKHKPNDPGGSVQVASFNIENFFTSIDDGEETCGPLNNFGCRGADSSEEYKRQLAKLVDVIEQTDASVIGLQELENNSDSTNTLIKALNNQAGQKKWAYIKTGVLGGDVIKVGLIYQPSHVTPVGQYALLNAQANPDFKENKNRIVVAQTFKSHKGNLFNVATAHLKSKSCRDAEGANEDQKDGQGCYNPVRTEVATQLSQWLNDDPTQQGADISILTGDLNSYQKEEPIMALNEHGFLNLAEKHLNEVNWTTGFRGQLGSLDYIMVNTEAEKVSTGLVQWHINSIYPREFGYDLEPLDDNKVKPTEFYQTTPFASSDHDVVLAGFDL